MLNQKLDFASITFRNELLLYRINSESYEELIMRIGQGYSFICCQKAVIKHFLKILREYVSYSIFFKYQALACYLT